MIFLKYIATIILAVIVISLFFVWDDLLGASHEARIAYVKKDISKISQSIENYKEEFGVYPSTEQGLNVLIKKGIVSEINADLWGEPYRYMYPGKHNLDGYDLWSTGTDMKDGGSGTAQDIGNWK